MTYPTAWQFLEITANEETVVKVYASWFDSWQLNSGCVKIEENEEYYVAHGVSGSVYYLDKTSYRTASSYAERVLDSLIKEIRETGHTVDRISVGDAMGLVNK